MFVDSIDSIDMSNREFIFSIGKVPLAIGLLHLISDIDLVVLWPHKCLSIRSICQMENSYFRSERCCFPLDCCTSLQGLHKRLSIRSIWSIRFEKPLTTIEVSCTNMAGWSGRARASECRSYSFQRNTALFGGVFGAELVRMLN